MAHWAGALGARFKTYERLKRYRASIGERRDLLTTDTHVRSIEKALEELYRFPLFQSAADTLNRQIKAGLDDHKLAELVQTLREQGRFVVMEETEEQREPRLICTMGLSAKEI